MIIIICLGILALLWPTGKTEVKDSAPQTVQDESAVSTSSTMATDLEKILTRIEGAGHVEVSISLASQGSKTYATNTRSEKSVVEERNSQGVSKTTNQENISSDLAVSAGSPLLLESKAPEVVGVLVVADGAASAKVRERLMNATATLLDIAPYKVRVMPREGG